MHLTRFALPYTIYTISILNISYTNGVPVCKAFMVGQTALIVSPFYSLLPGLEFKKKNIIYLVIYLCKKKLPVERGYILRNIFPLGTFHRFGFRLFGRRRRTEAWDCRLHRFLCDQICFRRRFRYSQPTLLIRINKLLFIYRDCRRNFK